MPLTKLNNIEELRVFVNNLESDQSSFTLGILGNDSDIASLQTQVTNNDSDILAIQNAGYDSDISALQNQDSDHSSDISTLQSTTMNTTDAFTKTGGNVLFNDGVRLRFGDSADMQFYHGGGSNYISGDRLVFDATNLVFTASTSNWQIKISNDKLVFAYAAVNVAELDSAGNLTVLGDINANGTVSG